ncbi:hypothetical protein FA246_04265, partial [Pseudomonas aeruginosa]|nr:hypothetical protein [Pseudomonas aeruginosa]
MRASAASDVYKRQGILGFALVMAVTGAMIDEGLLEKANNLVMSI